MKHSEMWRPWWMGPVSTQFSEIGDVWTHAWPQRALANPPMKYVQTQPVAQGSCFVGDMDLPVDHTIKLVDQALTRLVHKEMMADSR